MTDRKLKLLRDVHSDLPFPPYLTAHARVYGPNEIRVNPQGAVSVLTPKGWLGIKPSEMEWVND